MQRFDELIAGSTQMVLYYIHSRRWRENHDAAIKAFLGRAETSLEVFLPDLESHELIYSLSRHFEDGPQIPALVVDAYRYFARWRPRRAVAIIIITIMVLEMKVPHGTDAAARPGRKAEALVSANESS